MQLSIKAAVFICTKKICLTKTLFDMTMTITRGIFVGEMIDGKLEV